MTMNPKKGRIVIDSKLCKGCYLCMSVCPSKLIVISTELTKRGIILPNSQKQMPTKIANVQAVPCARLSALISQ